MSISSVFGQRWPRAIAGLYLLSILGFITAQHIGGVGLFQLGGWSNLLLSLPFFLIVGAMAWLVFQGKRWGWMLLTFLLAERLISQFRILWMELRRDPYTHPDNPFPSEHTLALALIWIALFVTAGLVGSLHLRQVKEAYHVKNRDSFFALLAALLYVIALPAVLAFFIGR
jgi:hypothetical protein